tara:strand:+ start:49 stop:591 length:543 start_codon:yes stop_codon:yes gene_type:complete
MKKNKKAFTICRFCGKKGIKADALKLSSGTMYINQEEKCKLCKCPNIHLQSAWGDYAWKEWKENGFTTRNIFKKKFAKFLLQKNSSGNSPLDLDYSINDIVKIYESNGDYEPILKSEIKKEQDNSYSAASDYEGSFDKYRDPTKRDIFIWILIFIFFAFLSYLLDDYGEPHGPRFFGDSY